MSQMDWKSFIFLKYFLHIFKPFEIQVKIVSILIKRYAEQCGIFLRLVKPNFFLKNNIYGPFLSKIKKKTYLTTKISP